MSCNRGSRRRCRCVLSKIHALQGDFELAYHHRFGLFITDTLSGKTISDTLLFLRQSTRTRKRRGSRAGEAAAIIRAIFNRSMVALRFLSALYFRHRGACQEEIGRRGGGSIREREAVDCRGLCWRGNHGEDSVSKGLHDGLGGMLSAVKLNLFDMKKGT